MKKILFLCLLVFVFTTAFSQISADSNTVGKEERNYLIKTLVKIANPVLTALSKNELKKEMPVESSGEHREIYTHTVIH